MKNEKITSESKEKKGVAKSTTSKSTPKSKTGANTTDSTSAATGNVKAKSGRGLANEGTVASYEGER